MKNVNSTTDETVNKFIADFMEDLSDGDVGEWRFKVHVRFKVLVLDGCADNAGWQKLAINKISI